MSLKDPEDYMPDLNRLRERNHYAKSWPLRIEKHTNRHRETGGGDWGWYEIHPLELHVGFWGTGRDDFKGVNIQEWNAKAYDLSMPRKDVV